MSIGFPFLVMCTESRYNANVNPCLTCSPRHLQSEALHFFHSTEDQDTPQP